MTGLESKASQPQTGALGRLLHFLCLWPGRQYCVWGSGSTCKLGSANLSLLSPRSKNIKWLESPCHSEAQASAPVPRTITNIFGTEQAAGRNVRPRAPSALGICIGRQQQPDVVAWITLNLRNTLALVAQLPCTVPAKPLNPACSGSLHGEAP